MLIIWQKQNKRNMLIKHDAKILPKWTEFVETFNIYFNCVFNMFTPVTGLPRLPDKKRVCYSEIIGIWHVMPAEICVPKLDSFIA